MFRFNEMISNITVDATNKGNRRVQEMFIKAFNKANKK